tara:strand:- start:1930 stop:2754 length:825 start_codon:yes stop_codon:yes gene_type:complete
MKFKHNKKRNTAFLYEVLIKELTKAVVSSNIKRKDFIVETIKKYFSTNKILGKELKIYRDLNETVAVDLYTAERLLNETRKDFDALDRGQVFNEQTSLINEINKSIGKETFNNFVPNYKNLATIYQIFLNKNTTKELILLERKLLSTMVGTKQPLVETKMPHVNNLTLSSFIKNYNNKYSGVLLENQQKLLNKYILSFSNNGLEFKMYLNEEVSSLKEELENLMLKEDVAADDVMVSRMKELQDLLESFGAKKIDDDLISKVLKIQSLIKEANE